MGNKWNNQKANNIIVELNPDISMIALNVNSLNTSIQRQMVRINFKK